MRGVGRKIAIAAIVLVSAVIIGSALRPTFSPSNALAPSIFISYDSAGFESRMLFMLDAERGVTSVSVSDERGDKSAFGRMASETDFAYDSLTSTVVFGGRTWKLTGEPGSRKLENVEAESGDLWGAYYEDEAEARSDPYAIPEAELPYVRR